MATVRTFVCIELPQEIKENIQEFQQQLRKIKADVRWVDPANVHLTLKFLGDVEQEKLNTVNAAVREFGGNESFIVEISETGAFPDLRRPRVYWVGIQESSGQLIALQSRIETALSRAGFPREERPFSPHLTIGRVKGLSGVNSVSERIKEQKIDFGKFEVNEIIVMKSDLKPAGPVYTPLYKYHFNDQGKNYGR